MKHFVIGTIILISSVIATVMLVANGVPSNLAKGIFLGLALIGGSLQAYAFYQAWQEHKRINRDFELERARTQNILRSLTGRTIALLLACVVVFSTVSCTAPTKTISGVTYSDYGILNNDDKNPNVKYEPNWRNIVLAFIFFEIIVPPIYVFGYHMMKPVGAKPAVQGQAIP